MSEPTPPPKRKTEHRAFWIAAIVIAVLLGLFLFYDAGFNTAPSVGGGNEDPETAAPTGVEPAEPNTAQ